MLEPEEKGRYEQLAKELGVTMRDLVRIAIERLVADRNAAAELPDDSDSRRERLLELVLAGARPAQKGAAPAALAMIERLRRVEDAVARILRRLDAANVRDGSND